MNSGNQSDRISELRRNSKSDLVNRIIDLEDQIKNIRLDVQRAEKRKKLFQKTINNENPGDYISDYFLTLPIKETSIGRIRFFKSETFGKGDTFSTGDSASDFEYLDTQIDDLLGGKNLLIIPDTSKIHSLQFHPGTPYPRSVLGFPLILDEKKIGFIWVGDTQYNAYSELDISLIQARILESQLALATASKLLEIQRAQMLLERAVDLIPRPVIILDINDNPVFANKLSIQKFKITESESGDLVYENLEIRKHISKATGEFQNFDGDLYEFTSDSLKIGGRNNFRVVILTNKSLDRSRSDYLSIILRSLENSLSTQLQEIKGYATLVSSLGNLSEKQRDYAEKIQKNIENIQITISGLTDIERLADDHLLDIQEMPVKDIFDSVTTILKPFINQKRIEIINNISKTEKAILTDPLLCKEVVVAVLNRALQETPIGGIIEVQDEEISGGYQISIKDSGKGIPKHDLDGLFDGSKKKENKYENLIFIKQVMDFLSGKLIIESNIGAGSSIKIIFPQKPE